MGRDGGGARGLERGDVDRRAARRAGSPESSLNLKDAVIIGLAQCFALMPGVSRSGATISAGLLRDLDRVAATRLAFFLAFRLWLPPGLPDASVARCELR